MDILQTGSWEAFGEWSIRGDFLPADITEKIYLILQSDQQKEISKELGERYLSGFPRLLKSEKLDLSLDDIIDPIGIGEKTSQERNCHPGRLTLNPDAYHHAYTMSLSLGRQMVRETMRCGPNGDWVGKHRLLDRPERDNGTTWYPPGLHDVYFLGGLPLIYWSRGNAMGMRVLANAIDQGSTMKIAGFQWRSATDLSEYTRMWYLPTERATIGPDIPEDWTPRYRLPRTYYSNWMWIGRAFNEWSRPVAEFIDGRNDTYINYIQIIEDIYRASQCHEVNSEDYCRIYAEELSGVEVRTLGGW